MRTKVAVAAAATLVAGWLLVAGLTRPGPIICDGGPYPDWVVASQTEPGSGCIKQPPLWEYLLPGHWGAPETCDRCLTPTND